MNERWLSTRVARDVDQASIARSNLSSFRRHRDLQNDFSLALLVIARSACSAATQILRWLRRRVRGRQEPPQWHAVRQLGAVSAGVICANGSGTFATEPIIVPFAAESFQERSMTIDLIAGQISDTAGLPSGGASQKLTAARFRRGGSTACRLRPRRIRCSRDARHYHAQVAGLVENAP